MEDVLVDWLEQFLTEPPIESLSDAQVLALVDLELDKAQQDELNELLWGNEEGTLGSSQSARLDGLLQVHRKGIVRKAQALQVVLARGLRLSLTRANSYLVYGTVGANACQAVVWRRLPVGWATVAKLRLIRVRPYPKSIRNLL